MMLLNGISYSDYLIYKSSSSQPTQKPMETKTKSSSMARLTEDLIVEILSRLPVKSLMRFKCVSKRWCSLISDTHFAKVQLRRAAEGNSTSSQRIIKNSSLQTFDYEALDNGEDYGVAVQLHTPGKDLEDSFGLVGHCDGLVCLACKGGGYMLYNPTTRQSRKLPNSGLVMQDDVFHGFGYDPTTDDYKILQGAFVSSHEAVMKIFALKSNYWKRIPNSHVTGAYEQGIYLNGALHWLVRHKIGSGKWVCSIVSFDLAEEKLKEVLKLPDVSPNIKLEGLGVHGARLFTYAGTWCDRFKAWIMHEYGEKESWAELFDVSMDGIVFPSDYWSKPLCYTKSGKIVFNVDGQKMLLFNSEESTLKPFPTQDADWESMIYLESLLSPYVGYFTRESRRDEGWQRVCIHIGNTFVWI